MALLLAVLQPAALVVLQHAMLAAEVPLAERAVAHDALRAVLAVFEGALHLLGGHAAADGERHVQGRGLRQEVRDRGGGGGGGGAGGGEVLAGVDEADVGCWGGCSEGEEVAEGGYRCVGGDGQGDGCAVG